MKTTKRAKPFGSPCSALQRLRQIAFNAATAGMRNPERNRGEDPPMWGWECPFAGPAAEYPSAWGNG